MAALAVFFGFFALMSVVALVRFDGNPLFIFSLLLSLASMAWLIRQELEDRRKKRSGGKRPPRGKKRG